MKHSLLWKKILGLHAKCFSFALHYVYTQVTMVWKFFCFKKSKEKPEKYFAYTCRPYRFYHAILLNSTYMYTYNVHLHYCTCKLYTVYRTNPDASEGFKMRKIEFSSRIDVVSRKNSMCFSMPNICLDTYCIGFIWGQEENVWLRAWKLGKPCLKPIVSNFRKISDMYYKILLLVHS